jgi:hypothetical protein
MTKARRSSDDVTLATICAAVLGVVFAIVALGTHDVRTAASVAVGAVIAVANLLTMRAIIRALLVEPDEDEDEDREKDARDDASAKDEADHRGAGRRGGAAWGIFALLKIFLLFGGIWILLTKKLVDPIPLVVGYGVLPLGIAASALVRALKPRR